MRNEPPEIIKFGNGSLLRPQSRATCFACAKPIDLPAIRRLGYVDGLLTSLYFHEQCARLFAGSLLAGKVAALR